MCKCPGLLRTAGVKLAAACMLVRMYVGGGEVQNLHIDFPTPTQGQAGSEDWQASLPSSPHVCGFRTFQGTLCVLFGTLFNKTLSNRQEIVR